MRRADYAVPQIGVRPDAYLTVGMINGRTAAAHNNMMRVSYVRANGIEKVEIPEEKAIC